MDSMSGLKYATATTTTIYSITQTVQTAIILTENTYTHTGTGTHSLGDAYVLWLD